MYYDSGLFQNTSAMSHTAWRQALYKAGEFTEEYLSDVYGKNGEDVQGLFSLLARICREVHVARKLPRVRWEPNFALLERKFLENF